MTFPTGRRRPAGTWRSQAGARFVLGATEEETFAGDPIKQRVTSKKGPDCGPVLAPHNFHGHVRRHSRKLWRDVAAWQEERNEREVGVKWPLLPLEHGHCLADYTGRATGRGHPPYERITNWFASRTAIICQSAERLTDPRY
jgi:hypothetical protein